MQLYPMKRILVCTDFSPSADLALKAAEILRCRNEGSTIHLLHVTHLGFHLEDVFTSSHQYNFREIFLSDLKSSIEMKMNDQIKRCSTQASSIIKEGSIVEIINELINENLFDLVVVGHGKSPFMSKALGSTAYKLISSTTLPLLLVKSPLQLEKVAGLVDESRKMDRIIIGTFDFAKNFKSNEVSFIALSLDFPEPFGNPNGAMEVRERLSSEVSYFSPSDIKPVIQVESTRELKLADHLERILKATHVNVAILKKFTDGNLKRFYMGSTTKKLLEVFDGNTLVLPP
jgi:nucleotide-binding universal stress UspA family protein